MMAGIGVLVDDGLSQGYVYKLLVPEGARTGSIVDLSAVGGGAVSTWLDTYDKVKRNSVDIRLFSNIEYPTSKNIYYLEVLAYVETYTYTDGYLVEKLITKISDASWVKFTYGYVDGIWATRVVTNG